jgi:hypothetical protein
MTPVYQRIIDRKNGDCLKCVIATLLDKPYEEVPHFIEHENWRGVFRDFLIQNNIKESGELWNKYYNQLYHTKNDCFKRPKYYMRYIMTKKRLYKEEGIDGLFYAFVFSPKYFTMCNDVTHAVLIDKDYNIVFDPNPEYQNIIGYPLYNLIKYNGICGVTLLNRI